jgi:long-chain acyl-CoA synthetase
MSIHWPIIRALAKSPGRVAIVDDKREYRAGEILVGAMHLAGHLAGKSQTRTVGLLLPTSGAFPIAALAAWILGKVVVPINYLLKPEEMNYVVRDCGCDTIVTAQMLLDVLNSGGPKGLGNADKEGKGATGADACLAGVRNIVRLEDVSFAGFPEPMWPARARDEDLGVLLYTSGTSGKPKGVMLTHGNISANIAQIRAWVDLDGNDVAFGVLPQFHTFGLTVLTLLPLLAGFKAVYTARFVPGRIIKIFREHRPTLFVAIPSMYNALLHAKDSKPEDFQGIRFLVSGGEPLPQVVFDTFRDKFGVTIAEGYGLTETSPVTNWCRPSEWKRGTVGRPLPWIDQKIVAIEGFGESGIGNRESGGRTWREVPLGQEGEIRMRGPNVMQGYYQLPDETAKAFDELGYFRTGDIGKFDEQGRLYITGRLKEMLIIGGENVFPREIEEVLNAHPSVKDSGVVGKKDPMRGELPVAFVEFKDGQTVDEKTLIQWCRSKLAGYKVPDEVRVLEALPRNPTGKVVRRELKKLVETHA